MPNLETAAVKVWLREHEGQQIRDAPERPVEQDYGVLTALQRCGTALDDGLAADGEALSRLLCSAPARDELRQIMAQLGTGRNARIFGWIMLGGMPTAPAVVTGLFTAHPTGSGQFLEAVAGEATRPALLSRLFSPARLANLLTACTHVSQFKEAA